MTTTARAGDMTVTFFGRFALSDAAAARVLGISYKMLRRKKERGRLAPAMHRVSGNRTVWDIDRLDFLLDDRMWGGRTVRQMATLIKGMNADQLRALKERLLDEFMDLNN